MSRLLKVGAILLGCLVCLAGGCGDDNGPVAPQNTPPAACFVVTPLEGTRTTEFVVDASCCEDKEDHAGSLEVRWDWENNGEWDTEWTTAKTASHQYATSGAADGRDDACCACDGGSAEHTAYSLFLGDAMGWNNRDAVRG